MVSRFFSFFFFEISAGCPASKQHARPAHDVCHSKFSGTLAVSVPFEIEKISHVCVWVAVLLFDENRKFVLMERTDRENYLLSRSKRLE